MQSYLASNSKSLLPSRSDSVIITTLYFTIFASWIEKKNGSYYNIRNIPYRFKLLYRASRDDNTAAAFHEKCDNKGPTIFIAKITNSEQIVSGYNPFDWIPISGVIIINQQKIVLY